MNIGNNNYKYNKIGTIDENQYKLIPSNLNVV